MNKNHQTALSYLIGTMRRSANWEKRLNEPETFLRWAGFSEWSGSAAGTRFYFNDPDAPNEKMYGYRERDGFKWNGGYEGTKKKIFKELNARNLAKMQAALSAAKEEMTAYLATHRHELPVFGEGAPGETRMLDDFPELGAYVRLADGKWESV